MKIIFLIPYPLGKTASQRFRFEQYLELLKSNNIHCTVSSFWGESQWDILYQKGNFLLKITGIIAGFTKRTFILFILNRYDFVFVHREVVPMGPPVIEWLIARVLRKKIIFDFDDAIWLPNASETNWFISGLKSYYSVRYLCKWSWKISVGNEYLKNYALQYNNRVILNPTTIDTENEHNKVTSFNPDKKFVIGWTGTHSTIRYLNEIKDIINELAETNEFTLCVISDAKPDFNIKSMVYLPWNKKSEIDDLIKFDIGIMPLTNDTWAHGKCGLKALQYMALGIPAVVSAVGVNNKIVDHGVNGFLCHSPGEWKKYLTMLLTNRQQLTDFGVKARKKIIEKYSVKSNADNFLRLFDGRVVKD